MSKYLTGGYEEEGDALFSVVPGGRTRGSGHILKHMKFHLNTRTLFAVKHWNRLLRKVVEFVYEDTQNPTGHGPGQPAVAGPFEQKARIS